MVAPLPGHYYANLEITALLQLATVLRTMKKMRLCGERHEEINKNLHSSRRMLEN